MKLVHNTLNTLVALLFFSAISTAQSQNVVPDAVERNTLLAIYNNTNGEHWVATKKWTLSRINSFPDSSLYGVNIVNGDIASLQIIGAGLNGTLPGEINNLTELKSLQISSNITLTDSLPYLGSLRKLNTLDFSGNRFTGNLPSWIDSLTELRSLSLAGNAMSGPIPTDINNLTHLTALSLNGINLSMAGAIPDSFSSLHSLQTLSLVGCSLLPNSVSSGLTGLAALYSLDLSSNPSFVMPDGTWPDKLINLALLNRLTLQNNNLQKLPDHFDQLSQLNFLDLSGNNFSDANRLKTIVDSLSNVPSLRTLLLNSCQIDDLPDNFNSLSEIESLYLLNNNLTPQGGEVIGALNALKDLHIANNGMSELPSTFSNLTTLRTLNASNNQLYPLPEIIKDISGLKVLLLNNNAIADLPSWFGTGQMNSLNHLELNNNLLTLPLNDNFAQLTNLTSLSIANNKLEGALPSFFSGFTKVSYLNLSYNKITSPLPDFSSYTSLNYIFLQNNNLTGVVPATLSNMVVAKIQVNISHNHFDTMTEFLPSNSLSLVVNNNRFDFVNILKVARPVQQYIYTPQDTVITLMGQPNLVTAYVGDTLRITAAIDRTTVPPSQYQWFKYVDGINDIPLTGSSAGGFDFTNSNFAQADEGKYYYKVTNQNAPGLTLVSPIITVNVAPCKTNADMTLTYSRYVCAYVFNPPANSFQCKGIAYQWDFGDNFTSSEKNPVHGYKQAGTYTVSLALTFKCGTICQADTTIQKQIMFDPNEDTDLFRDSLVQILSDQKQEIISSSAATFSDVWPLQHTNPNLTGQNNFENGTRGVWRNNASYAYQAPRSQSAQLNVSKDGTFNMESFNWQQAEFEAVPHWIKVNTMTQYSPFSYELENRDIMGIYSAAVYDYGGHLPSANGTNMRNNEMAFTSFEYIEGSISGNWVIGTQPIPTYSVYDVKYGYGNMAIVETRQEKLKDVHHVYVSANRLAVGLNRNNFNYLQNDSVVCRQVYHDNHSWTALIVKDAPFTGVWRGRIMIKNQLDPIVVPQFDTNKAHSGNTSLHITYPQTFKQGLIHLDSAKSYVVSMWVSVVGANPAEPKLADNLGVNVQIKNSKGVTKSSIAFQPSGAIIEGWQQVKGTFICPANDAQLEITFQPGSRGQAWYDDLRLHPQDGNMKSYVYDLNDYRLMSTLDEENFASFFYYDKEGNLYLVKKETEKGVKTISENLNWIGNK